MESQNHNLLVVSLDSVTSGDNTEKANSCLYTAPMSTNMEAPLLQLAAPIHCLGAAVPRLHSNLTHLQPLQAVSFDPGQQMQQQSNLLSNHTIYQPVSAGMIHHFAPTQHLLDNNPYLNASSVTTLHIPSHSVHNQQPPTPEQTFVQTSSIEGTDPLPNIEKPLPAVSLEPAFPEDDFEYYMEIETYLTSKQLPSSMSENYQKRLIQRSKHYKVQNGKLYHNVQKPREVVRTKEEQRKLLQSAHILKDSGVHVGVKKMFSTFKTKYFWRGMYTDIASFTKNCTKCSEIADTGQQTLVKCEEFEDIDDPAPINKRTVGTQCVDSWGVWKKVELQLHESLPKTTAGHNRLITMTDPVSCWVSACPVPADMNQSCLAISISQFILKTFCTFGFARCCFVQLSSDLKDYVAKELDSKRENIAELYLDSVIEARDSNCKWIVQLVHDLVTRHTEWDQNLDVFLFDHRTGNIDCPDNVTAPFSSLFNHNPFSITNELDRNTDENKENIAQNSNSSERKRMTQSGVMECSVCEEVFTSKISFQIHQQRHRSSMIISTGNTKCLGIKEKTRKTATVEVEATPSSKHLPSSSSTVGTDSTESGAKTVCMESTVLAVKSLLAETREERRKRGKYLRFSPQIQKLIADFVMKRGVLEAAKYFSFQFRKEVSVRTIRRVMNLYSKNKTKVTGEIDRFAASYGVDQSTRNFSEKCNRNIPLSLDRKFKNSYPEKLPNFSKGQVNAKRRGHERDCTQSMKGKRLNSNLKEAIGHYASQHSVRETIEYFSPKVQRNLKEQTIEKCLNAYLDTIVNHDHSETRTTISKIDESPEMSPIPNQVEVHHDSVVVSPSKTLVESKVTSESILRTESQAINFSVEVQGDFISNDDSPSTVIVTQTDSFPSQSSNSRKKSSTSQRSGPVESYVSASSQGELLSFPVNDQPQASKRPSDHSSSPSITAQRGCKNYIESGNSIPSEDDCVISNSLLCDTNVINLHSFQDPIKETIPTICDNRLNSICDKMYSSGGKVDSPVQILAIKRLKVNYEECETNSKIIDGVNCISEDGDIIDDSCSNNSDYSLDGNIVVEHESTIHVDDSNINSDCNPNDNKNSSDSSKGTKKKRGCYTAYSPELRADIGKYAAEYGCFKARLHFQKVLGHVIPESTIRGLSKKYLKKQAHCKVTSLGYNRRGRPLRLGKYDEIVQQTLKQLFRSGERASSFVVIATARQILNSAEPELLEENGGPIKLNITWAKSFLKRIGVHNNS